MRHDLISIYTTLTQHRYYSTAKHFIHLIRLQCSSKPVKPVRICLTHHANQDGQCMPADCDATCGSKVYKMLVAAAKIPLQIRWQLTGGTWGSDDQGAIDSGTQGRVAIVPYQEGDLQNCANRQAGVDVAVLQAHLGKLLACTHPNHFKSACCCCSVYVCGCLCVACDWICMLYQQSCWTLQASRLARKSISAAQIELSP